MVATFEVRVFYSRFKVGLTVVVLCLALRNSWTLLLGASMYIGGITSGFILCCYVEIMESERWKDVVMYNPVEVSRLAVPSVMS